MQFIIIGIFTYLLFAIPLSLLIVGLSKLLIKIKTPKIINIIILSISIFTIFMPMMGGGGAALITFPSPALGGMFNFHNLSWQFDKWPIFISFSFLATFIISIYLSIKLIPNK